MATETRTVRAVLFDVGGPIDTEVERERYIDATILRVLTAAGVTVTPEAYAAANDAAVASFAPDAYAAIIFSLTGGDRVLSERLHCDFHETRTAMPPMALRPGVRDLLAGLTSHGIDLGLAANQPASALAALDDLGVGEFFKHREVSGVHGLRKPDLRLFLRACDDLGVQPDECIMVGDRIDNDIAPARALGMQTVLFRTGRHIAQQPRSHEEVPHETVSSVPELTTALSRLVGVEL